MRAIPNGNMQEKAEQGCHRLANYVRLVKILQQGWEYLVLLLYRNRSSSAYNRPLQDRSPKHLTLSLVDTSQDPANLAWKYNKR